MKEIGGNYLLFFLYHIDVDGVQQPKNISNQNRKVTRTIAICNKKILGSLKKIIHCSFFLLIVFVVYNEMK